MLFGYECVHYKQTVLESQSGGMATEGAVSAFLEHDRTTFESAGDFSPPDAYFLYRQDRILPDAFAGWIKASIGFSSSYVS